MHVDCEAKIDFPFNEIDKAQLIEWLNSLPKEVHMIESAEVHVHGNIWLSAKWSEQRRG